MKTAVTLAFVLLTCTSGEMLFAQAAHSELKPIAFRTLDANNDGRISLIEARADPGLYEAFAMLDVNHDGYLSPAEFQAWPRALKTRSAAPDPATSPGGSAGAQHMPPPQ
ncbi:MAG TPA: EF-hand domain-containing protein [Steroidobacteraceae bacterium]